MMENLEEFESAVRTSEPVDALRKLALEFAARSYSRDRVRELFQQFLVRLQEGTADREADEDAVMDGVDMIDGWCGPHARLFPAEASPKSVD
jgi:hypothetical protein